MDVNCTVHSFGLRAGEQAQLTVFGGIGTAIEGFNWIFVFWIFLFWALHPLFHVSNTQNVDTHVYEFRFDTLSWQASVSPAENISCFEQNTLRVGLIKHGLFDWTGFWLQWVIFFGNEPV